MLIFKVNFEKAFDSVSWKYLDFVLHSFGFGSKWRSWIRECLHSSRASVLVNGSPTSEFSIKRGLRHGDPLSPFLFILVMEGLYYALSNAVNSGLTRGINLGSPDITISHLFYVDDVVITTEWKKEDLDNIIRVLHVFYLASGLKINIHKSNIYGIGVFNEEVSDMVTSSGCTAGDFPFQLFSSQDSKKIAWIKWSNVLSSFEKEGLNIGSLKAFNLALLQKWRWRMYYFLNALWIKVIKAHHGEEGGFDNHGCKFNGTWAKIVGSSNYLHSKDIIPLNSFRFQAGCGTKIQFLKDIWIGDSPLNIRYNRLYRMEHDKDCLIIDRIDNGHWSWNWSRIDIGVRNMDYLHDMLLEISLVDTHPVEDSCLWSMAIDGLFSVGTSRHIIDAKLLPSLVLLTPWDKILPCKVNIFIWRLSLNRLPHRLNLSSRGIDILKISCSSCNGNVKSSNHIFFACDIAMEV
ncbi:RNA-directed DNA polymerase, eukaryota, reverse transcriptase zinc-binding domain protein [Tanacetum coccineum]